MPDCLVCFGLPLRASYPSTYQLIGHSLVDSLLYLILITCLSENVLKLKGEVRYQSPMRVKGLREVSALGVVTETCQGQSSSGFFQIVLFTQMDEIMKSLQ